MNIEHQKIELIKWLTDLEDADVMAKLKAMKDESSDVLTPSHKEILDDRLLDLKNNPDKGSSWEEVKRRLLTR